MKTTSQISVNVIEDPQSAQVVMNPLRRQILEKLRNPDSASGLSRHFQLPRQKINYHLRELEKRGLVEQVEERRKGNCIERIVRARAKSFIINPETLGDLNTDPEKIKDKFSSSYLVAIAAQTIRELAVLRMRAEKAKKKLATFTLQTEVRFASAQTLNEFTEELTRTIANLAAKYHDEQAEGGRSFKFIVGSYPTITKTDKEESEDIDTSEYRGME